MNVCGEMAKIQIFFIQTCRITHIHNKSLALCEEMKLKEINDELILMFLKKEKEKTEFIQLSGEDSSRENFLV